MKKKKLNPSLKVALASTIAVTSAATIIYNMPETVKTVAVESNESDKFILDVEKVDNDTIKVSLDNIEDIPKALQFSIKLDGVVLKEENGSPLIKDLVNIDKSDSIITDYTYNKENNTVDVLITSNKELPKEGNKVDIFELDIEKAANNTEKKYTVTATNGSTYKYVSSNNKEYIRSVEIANDNLSINTAPTIKKKDGISYIEINAGEKLSLTKDELIKYIEINDADGDNITLEVKDINDKVITEFTKSAEGIYDVYIVAKDGYDSSESLNLQIKVNVKNENPIITKNEEELKDIIIKSGQFDTIEALREYLIDGVEAIDIDNNKLSVDVEFDENIVLSTEKTEVYLVTYKAKDSQNRETIKQIALTIRVNTAPIINGVEDHVLTVGDEFDPREGVTVEDDYDDNIELEIYIDNNKLEIGDTLDTSKDGEYTITYIAEDSDGAVTEAISKITINPKDDSEQDGDDNQDDQDNENGDGQGGSDDTSKPGEGTTIVIPDFIDNIIDDKVISKVSGEATTENPLVLDIQNVSVNEFNRFIDKLKDLNPTLIKKYTDGNYTVYRIKLENSKNLIQKIFSFGRANEEGIVEIRVLNTLDNEKDFNDTLNKLLNINLDGDDGNGSESGNQGGDDGNGSGSGNQGGNDGNGSESGSQGGNDGNGSESGSQGESTEGETVTITPDKADTEEENTDSSKQENSKLPITGQESMLGVLGLLAVSIGGIIYKKKK